MESLKQGTDTLFILLGAIMVLAMHAGFAFLELGTVRKKNQVNALVKILVDFSVSTVVYFAVGYGVAYGTHFFMGAETLAQQSGYALVKFFFLLTFAAAIPAIPITTPPSCPRQGCLRHLVHQSINIDMVISFIDTGDS